MLNQVIISGVVTSIDSDKRDVILSTFTPKGKEVTATVHMWKVQGIDSDDPEHADRDSWRDRIDVGMDVAFRGHMGNNGRIIATGFATAENTTEGGVC
jgi:hypothetical protein